MVFCFPIPIIGNSVYLAILIASVKLLYQGKIGKVLHYVKSGYIASLIIWTIGLIFAGIIFTIINVAFDFSRVGALCSLFVGLVSVIIVYFSLCTNLIKYENPKELMERMIVYLFAIQSVISIGSFVSPPFKGIISIFQFEGESEIAEEAYSGVRGLALSGRLYYEYAATCGLITIFQFRRIIEENKVTGSSIILLLMIVICGFFAGRTALVGFAIGLALCFFSKTDLKFKVKILFKLFLITFLFCGCIWMLMPIEIKYFITDHLLPWVFDLFIKYYETGSTESSHSFNSLNEMYHNVKISEHEWFIGSGMYMDPSGKYYGHVDAGYLRQILYWGITGSLISFMYTFKIFQYPLHVSKDNRNEYLFILTIFVYTLIVHYKGDLLSTCRFYYDIIYLYLISIWQTHKKIRKVRNNF